MGRGPSDEVGLQRAMAARAKERRRDPDGVYHAKLRYWADQMSRDMATLVDEWVGRAEAREYGGQSPDTAEREAFADIVQSAMQGALSPRRAA